MTSWQHCILHCSIISRDVDGIDERCILLAILFVVKQFLLSRMSIALLKHEPRDFLAQEYEGEWESFSLISGRTVETPLFSPIPNNSAKFSFVIHYERKGEESNSNNVIDELSVQIIRFSASSEFSRPKGSVSIYYGNSETLYQQFYLASVRRFPDSARSSSKKRNVELKPLKVTSIVSTNGCLTDHGNLFNRNNGKVKLSCYMTFSGHLGTISAYKRTISQSNGLIKMNQKLSNFNKNFNVLYETKYGSDLTFSIDGKTVLAHKCVLIAHSPVFHKMLDFEISNSDCSVIIMINVNVDQFECFLKYLYSGILEDGPLWWLKDICLLAHQYDVQSLIQDCGEMIVSKLSSDDICSILKFAGDHSLCDLKEKAIQYAVDHYSELKYQKDWPGMVLSHPQIVCDVLTQLQEYE